MTDLSKLKFSIDLTNDAMHNVVFMLTIEDFELVLGRKLDDNEIMTIRNKFVIDDWTDIVENFASEYLVKDVSND